MKFLVILHVASTSREPSLREGDNPIVSGGNGIITINIIIIRSIIQLSREEGAILFLAKEGWLR